MTFSTIPDVFRRHNMDLHQEASCDSAMPQGKSPAWSPTEPVRVIPPAATEKIPTVDFSPSLTYSWRPSGDSANPYWRASSATLVPRSVALSSTVMNRL